MLSQPTSCPSQGYQPRLFNTQHLAPKAAYSQLQLLGHCFSDLLIGTESIVEKGKLCESDRHDSDGYKVM